jgi:hypothetical protein
LSWSSHFSNKYPLLHASSCLCHLSYSHATPPFVRL